MKRADCQNTDSILNKSSSIYIFPLVISLLMCIMVGMAVIRTESPYTLNTLIGIVIILTLWSALFLHDQRKVIAGLSDREVSSFIAILLSAVAAGLFFAYAMWGTGYLSLDPMRNINSGLQHQDSLYQSAIAESYNRSIFPSALVNQEAVLRYHTFSCLVVNLLSRIFKMPCFFVYCYLYPILILPIYGLLQYIGILAAKKYFLGVNTLELSDIILVTIYNIGLFSLPELSHFGIWKSSYVNSESFVTANAFAILFFILCFRIMETKKYKAVFLFAGIPITLFILSWTKISVGFLVMIAVLYYFFRTRLKSIKYWLLNFYYLVIFIGGLILFKGGNGGNAGSSKAGLQLFAFGRYCDDSISGLCGHYFILSFMAIVFILFNLKNKKYSKTDFINGKTLWVEIVSIVTICSFLPGMLLDIGGGSAVYFSYFSEIPALFLLCGHRYLEGLFPLIRKVPFAKLAVYIVVFGWMFRNVWVVSHSFYIDKEDKTVCAEVDLYESAMAIRKLVADAPEDFTIYLDEDAEVFEVYSTSIAGIYIYPALSGVGVINASYCLGGVNYTIQDVTFRGYALAYVDHPKLTFAEALQCARELGKKKVIRMKQDGYEVIDLRAV